MQGQEVFRGRLEEVHFAGLLLKISQSHESGVLHIWHANIEKDIYFQEGHIVFAKSNDPDERLGELLLRRGKITAQQFEDAASKIVPGMRLGTILVQEGHIKPNDLYQGVIDQVEEILYSLFEWTEGEFEFTPGELPSKEVITLSISTADIIRTGIGRIWRWSWVKETVSLDMVLEKKETPTMAKKMMITPGMQRLLDMLDQPRSVRQVIAMIGGNNFETCKMIWSLMTIGILAPIESVDVPLETPAPEVTSDIFAAASATEAPVSTVLMRAPVLPPEPRIEPLPESHIEPPLEPPFKPLPGHAPHSPAPRIEAPPTVILVPGTLPPVPPPMAVETVESAPNPGVELSFSDLADLAGVGEMQAAAPAESNTWEKSVEKDVQDFNEKHRYLFEMLRIEMGAGVSNFLGKILKKATAKNALVFEGVQMNEFGELNVASLAGNIVSNLSEGYPQVLASLLKDEIATIKSLLDKKRLSLIETGLARIEESQKNRK